MGGYIPNDIMDTATALAKRLTDEMDHHEYASIIGKALMDERDRCASKARSRIIARSPNLSELWEGYRMAAVCIEIDILSEDEDG